MPIMMFNGVPYGTGGGLTIVQKTRAEYESLTEDEKLRDDVIYEITDETGSVNFGRADISGIGDGTVTGAIVELDSMRKTKTIIMINDCSTTQEIGDLMLANADKIGKCEIGDSSNNPIQNVVGNPTGYSNYTNAFFEVVSEVLIRVTAINLLGTARPQTGYIWHNAISWLWSGWG